MINVTKTYLPTKEEYDVYLNKIWENGWITNNGELVKELELKLKEYFGVKHLFYVSNGTIALQIALKALGIKGEVITTPFSYVATTSAILWENCTPRFVDINPHNFGIDANMIESKITSKTTAILSTHVYGIPNDIDKISKIAIDHNLKVLYDAAHCFGSNFNGKSLMQYGDISTISFHATKLFHTVEGGAIATNDDELAYKIDLYRRFGHSGDDYYTIGINGKNSELHAAMGLALFPLISDFINKRRQLVEYYDEKLKNIAIIRPIIINKDDYNFAYYPIIFEDESKMSKVKMILMENDIIPRRYFYPSLNKLSYLKTDDQCPVSESYASRVLCLPLFHELENSQVNEITELIILALKS